MENKNSIMPEFHLFPRLERIARAIGNLFCMHQLSEVSKHKFEANHGAAPMIDRELYDKQPVCDISGLDLIAGMNQVVDSSIEID